METAPGTKSAPGKYNCYAKAAPDEPMFVLLARDPLAPILVRLWADLAQTQPTEKREQAQLVAYHMQRWYDQQHHKKRTA